MFETFKNILNARQDIRQDNKLSPLNQGTRLPKASISPYSFKDTLQFGLGMLFGDRASSNKCKSARPGRQLTDYASGLKKGTFNHIELSDERSLRIIVAGDMMVSKSGLPIKLCDSMIDIMCKADVFVINIEAPVNFDTELKPRSGLNFSMSQGYLDAFVKQLKERKPDLKIVYDIANNHSLDAPPLKKLNEREKALLAVDKDNFPLLRTVAAIREMDNDAIIIGAHLAEEKYRAISYGQNNVMNCYVEPLAVIDKNWIRCGLVGFTDVLNHNAFSWDKRVVRTEDFPDDLEGVKEKHNLNQLCLIGHGNLEQSIHPKPTWRRNMLRLLNNGADAVFGHGPHVPLTNEVISIKGRKKFVAHSLGNLYGPTKLGNTGLNALVDYTVYAHGAATFEMIPIEATHDKKGQPVIDVVASKPHYPKLLKRFNKLYPLDENIEIIDPLSEIDLRSLDDNELDIIDKLRALKAAANDFLENNHDVEAQCADHVYNVISSKFSAYCGDKTKLESFKTMSLEVIAKADAALLDNHHLKKILLNLGAGILSLGSAFFVNKWLNGHYAFFNEHRLSKPLDGFKHAVENVARN